MSTKKLKSTTATSFIINNCRYFCLRHQRPAYSIGLETAVMSRPSITSTLRTRPNMSAIPCYVYSPMRIEFRALLVRPRHVDVK